MTAADTTVSLSPIINQLVEIGVLVLTGVVTWAVARVQSYIRKNIGLTIDDKTRTLLEAAIDNGIAYAAKKIEVEGAGLTVDAKNAQVAAAANYVVAHAPDALKHFGVTPEALTRKIIAQLPSDAPTVPAP